MDIPGYLAANHYLFLSMTVLIGLIAGSFLNVVIYRLPIILENHNWEAALNILGHSWPAGPTFNLLWPLSFCPHCFKQLSYWAKIPILSFLIFRGRAYCCQKKISLRYPAVELLTAILVAFLAWHFGPSLKFLFSLIFTTSLIALFCIDIDTLLLPDQITLPLLWIGFCANIQCYFTTLTNAVFGAISGYTFFYGLNYLMLKIRKIEGLGRGDFKLMAALGAWFGWQLLPIILFIASLMGMVFGLIYVNFKNVKFTQPLPFGPFLSLAGFFVLLYGTNILNYHFV